MRANIILFGFVCFLGVLSCFTSAEANSDKKFPNLSWLTVSDPSELERSWTQSLVYLPQKLVSQDASATQSVKLLTVPGKLDEIIRSRDGEQKLPVILFLHSCEGFGEHREDMRRLAKIGFVVIAPDSFARDYRPLGCYEDRSKFLPSFNLAAGFQKAELEYAVLKLAEYSWIDRRNLILFGSGMGGMVAAQYAGDAFNAIVIEGWGCEGPNPVFNGIWAPEHVRVFTAISRNDPFYLNNPGFGNNCASYLKNRSDSSGVIVDRPAHFVSWYPGAYEALIRFLTINLDVDTRALVSDEPAIIKQSENKILLQQKWSDEAVYAKARQYCAGLDLRSHLIGEPKNEVYEFVCE